MDKNKRWWIVGGAAALAGVLVLVGCQMMASQQAQAQTTGQTATIRRDTLQLVIEATGSVQPRTEVDLAFSSSGRVEAVLVAEGDAVEAAQPLGKLELDELALQVAQAEAQLAAAEAQLAELLAPPREEEIALQQANLAATEAQISAAAANRDDLTGGADAAQIASAEAQVASAQAQQKVAQDTHDATMKCVTVNTPDGGQREVCPGLGTREEQARYNLHSANEALAAAQAQLDLLLEGADAEQRRAAEANVWAATAQRDAAQAQLDLLLAGASEEQIESAQAAVDQAQVSLDQARLRFEQATLRAPAAGVVAALIIDPGEWVSPGQPALTLADLSVLEVALNLDETDVARVAVGQEAQVTLDAFPGVELNGEVIHVAPVAQPQAGVVLYPVTVRLLGVGETGTADGPVPVRAGMTADVRIVAASRENVLIAPLRAVRSEGDETYVERLVGDRTEPVPVSLGEMTDTEIEIVEGLAEGDVVAVIPGPVQSSSSQLPTFLQVMHGEE